ncbi:MAG: hypothetical protein MUF69_06170 [Desulfobacterota bacterium]|nr:hypothetical protein [Thermodesulfobacteriota bacterium]
MKKSRFILLIVLCLLCLPSSVWAEDTGWLQPGVRVWYIGGTGFTDNSSASFSTNTQEADLIHSSMGGILYVVQQQAISSWNIAIPATNWVHAIPSSEGLFWINPQRLKAMQAGQEIQWLNNRRTVLTRASYTSETLPFLKLLPLDALFKLSPSREFVVLTNAGQSGMPAGQYVFDVETGLLCSKPGELGTPLPGGDDVADEFTRHILVLAEIYLDLCRQAWRISRNFYYLDWGKAIGVDLLQIILMIGTEEVLDPVEREEELFVLGLKTLMRRSRRGLLALLKKESGGAVPLFLSLWKITHSGPGLSIPEIFKCLTPAEHETLRWLEQACRNE